ncbi:lasso peptide biosynthesis B2 protein [Bacillus sp. ISL-41]|uniref:lasso peptide biosynthesis B2 protein n=1 Tax=Bacillus sp. ISL-41 TaxID=2819127 RepID=UPI001BEA4D9C|nr:lasso peptide biosynthesis B2 protein [Bacillus sp. ISL-41]MBT2642183.1 lasso peptide biosynthesis B2 protein [Bacillus sp. ISL-41]
MKLLLIEAFFLLAWARVVKRVPFQKASQLLGKKMIESSRELDIENLQVAKKVAYAVKIISKYTFWESQCLVQAIAAMFMLRRRKIDSTLYLGTAKEKDGNLIAHAWLRSGSIYITGSEEMKNFVVVYKFASNGRGNY